MASDHPLNVVLCWHMHQPEYRDHLRNEFQLPWTYLHGIRDYVDMAAHVEAVPGARAVFNFSPILLEQLVEYETQIRGYLQNSRPIRDPLLAMLDSPVFPVEHEQRIAIVKSCLRANEKRLISRYQPYQKLVEIARLVLGDPQYSSYISNQYLADLVTWYHLVWLGESVRRTDARIQELLRQGAGYTLHQRRQLLQIIYDLLSGLRSRYAALAQEGRIELSMSPYSHPMLPLLLQFKCARDSQPEVRLPLLDAYPGGRDRSRWHLDQGLRSFENFFGSRPTGCWPSEGGVSIDTLKALTRAGFQWAATGENVLRNSIRACGLDEAATPFYTAFLAGGAGIRLFARDDTLSDLIGFTYSEWHADDAVGDLINRLVAIADRTSGQENAVASIILDGENAWEYYPENGYYFLSALYQRLSEHPRLKLCLYRDLLGIPAVALDRLTSGSWVFGTFSTWIGDEDKNRAWDILGEAKRVYDQNKVGITGTKRRELEKQLAVCEGSDWFWWFGDYNPSDTVSDFDRLYRIHIANLYHMLGQESPQYLSQTISHGSGSPLLGGVIRPGSEGGA